MAVTIPMIMSETAAIQRNPAQEVKSTCDETQVIIRMKVKLICFKPDEREAEIVWKGDQNKEGKKRDEKIQGWMCHAAAQKCNSFILTYIRRRSWICVLSQNVINILRNSVAHCHVRQRRSFTLTTKTSSDKPWAAELQRGSLCLHLPWFGSRRL